MTMYVTTVEPVLDISSIQTVLVPYFAAQEQIAVAYLFGSVARGQASPLSDIDIAILLQSPQDAAARFSLRLRVTKDIKALVRDRDIDVIVLDDVPLAVSYRVIRDGVVLIGRRLADMASFRNVLVHMYVDVDPDRLFEYLHGDLDDFNTFARCIGQYLETL